MSPSSGKLDLFTGSTKIVEYAAARQPDSERVVVADAIGLQHRLAGAADLTGDLVYGALDAPAGHAPHHVARRGYG